MNSPSIERMMRVLSEIMTEKHGVRVEYTASRKKEEQHEEDHQA